MKKYLNVIVVFVFAITLLSLSRSAHAQLCSELPGFDIGDVFCDYPPLPEGTQAVPGDPICPDDPDLLVCTAYNDIMCTNQPGGYSCVSESAACPGNADSNNFVCTNGQKCCDPPDPTTYPACNSGPLYQDCSRATGNCTGASGDGWQIAPGNWSCPSAGYQCCIQLCENPSELPDDYYCAAVRDSPEDQADNGRYCSGGLTCWSKTEVSGFVCETEGGTCEDDPSVCGLTGRTYDANGQCTGGDACCIASEPTEVTCEGSAFTCIASSTFQSQGCPSAFPDLNTSLTCEPTFTCCEARSECTPSVSDGCINHGTYWDCPNCGGDCGTDQRCAVTANAGVYRCAPCTVSEPCHTPDACGEAGGCGPGERCEGSPGIAYCYTDIECGLALLESNPYTGPIVSFNELLARIYFFMYPAGIAVGLFFIAKAGYTIMMSEGNPAKVSEGKEELTSAVIGTLFILLSLVILRVIISALLGATI
jgi:hypothetical protein